MITIYRWPNGTWCENTDYYQFANWMSDDFEVHVLTQEQYEVFLETDVI